MVKKDEKLKEDMFEPVDRIFKNCTLGQKKEGVWTVQWKKNDGRFDQFMGGEDSTVQDVLDAGAQLKE